jgi:hypothetical protein
VLFNASDGAASAGKKDKFLIEWISVLPTDNQTDAKALWQASAQERSPKSHKLAAFVMRRPDSVQASADPTSAIATRRGRAASKLASSVSASDDLAAIDDASASTVVASSSSPTSAVPVVATATATVAAAAAAAAVVGSAATVVAATPLTTSRPAEQPSGDVLAQLRAQLNQVTQERDQLAKELAAAQRTATAGVGASAKTGAVKTSREASGSERQYLLAAIVIALLAFLLGRLL